MSITASIVASTLKSPIAAGKDGLEGFQNAAEKVKAADLKSPFIELASHRPQFTTDLQRLARDFGDAAAEPGSVAATGHRTWIDLKSALAGGDEHTILKECDWGEDSAVAEYREALGRMEPSAHLRGVIQDQERQMEQARDHVRTCAKASIPEP